jgi:trypsin-like peptidase
MNVQINAAIVRVLTTQKIICGVGLLVSKHHLLTCAHVVADALGLPDNTDESPRAKVNVDFPMIAPGQILTGHVVLWQPPRANNDGGDIVVLELDSVLPAGAQPVSMVLADDMWGHQFGTVGFPSLHDNGVNSSGVLRGQNAAGWVQMDVDSTGYRIAKGFSGAPVWDIQLHCVVGVVVQAETDANTRIGFMIPTNVLARAWPDLAHTIPTHAPKVRTPRQCTNTATTLFTPPRGSTSPQAGDVYRCRSAGSQR